MYELIQDNIEHEEIFERVKSIDQETINFFILLALFT